VIRVGRMNDGFSAMKMKAIIEVEFEANEDQDENVLRAALFRGRDQVSRNQLSTGLGELRLASKPGR